MSFDAYTTSGQGQNVFQQLPIQSTRNPVNQVDYNDPTGGPYQIGRRWFNKVSEDYWRYAGQGTWILDSGNPGPMLEIGVPAGTSPITPDVNGLVNFTSNAGTITISGSAGGVGLQNINFDLSGGGVSVDSFQVDASTAPGTNPVVPTVAGLVTIEGGVTYATGTRSRPIRSNSLAVNTIDLEVQLAGSNAAVSTANNFGVSQFDSNQFTVASGFVQLKGGGVNPSLTKLGVDYGANNPVVPDSTGKLNILGGTVVAGTNPIRTNGTGVNTSTIEVQLSQAIVAQDTTKVGLSNFDSASFSVTNGFVKLVSFGTFNKVVRQVFTSNGTYTPTSGMKYADVEIIGGGGGGGGSGATAAGTASGGAGGAGGGYSRKMISAATIGVSQTVTIGGAGTAGTAGGASGGNGGTGGTSSLGALISATGGSGGTGGAVSANIAPTAVHVVGGVGSGGDFNVYGSIGEGGFSFQTMGYGGNGGDTFYGSGGAVSGSNPGNASRSYGAGGGAGSGGNGSGGNVGTVGTSGIIVITEYCG